jgi:hypothetical protein
LGLTNWTNFIDLQPTLIGSILCQLGDQGAGIGVDPSHGLQAQSGI